MESNVERNREILGEFKKISDWKNIQMQVWQVCMDGLRGGKKCGE